MSSRSPSTSPPSRIPVKQHVLLAIDVESRGENMITHGIVSIGWCVGCADEFHVIERGRVSLKPLPGQTFERRCIDEFWSKYKDQLHMLQKEAVDADRGMSEFRQKMQEYDRNYRVTIVSDNPAFDIGIVNYYLNYHGYPWLQYTFDDDRRYRSIYCAEGFARGAVGLRYETSPFTNKKKCVQRLGSKLVSGVTHSPDDDARAVYEFHIKCLRAFD